MATNSALLITQVANSLDKKGVARRLGMNLTRFHQELKAERQRATGLYLNARKYLVQQQELLAEAFEVIDNALEKLEIAEKELRQQNDELIAVRQAVELERQSYKNLLEFGLQAYLVTDLQGIIRQANRAASKLLNIPHQYLAGKVLAMYVSKEQRRTFLSGLNRLHNAEQELEVRLQPRNCEALDVLAQVNPIRNQEGKAIAFNWLLRPITKNQQADSLVWLLKDALQQVDESIVITSAELNEPGPEIIFVNSAFTTMTGYSVEELIGKTPRILHGPKTDRLMLARLRQDLSQEQTFQGEMINYHKGGNEYKVQIRCSPIRNENGEVTHYISTQRQIALN